MNQPDFAPTAEEQCEHTSRFWCGDRCGLKIGHEGQHLIVGPPLFWKPR